MSPEAPPPDPDREDRPRGDPRFGPESAASIERTLASLVDPDDALRILALVKEGGAGFAAFLQLPDTNIAAVDLDEAFHAAYVDAWESFDELRRDILEALGWLDAVKAVMTEQGIPEDQLIWNHPAIDIQIFDTYDAVHLDGWWHLFNK